MNKIVLASGNPGKLREFSTLFSPLNFTVVPQSEFDIAAVEESGQTFIENAIIKARHAAQQSGLPALADDSGLEVDYLKGAPGIYSARYAGADASDNDNLRALLTALDEVPQAQRTARYQCVLVLMRHADDPTPLIAQAHWEGRILTTPEGDGGFGYDPVFWVPEMHCSAAQLTPEQKQALSHRGKAMQQLIAALKTRSLSAFV